VYCACIVPAIRMYRVQKVKINEQLRCELNRSSNTYTFIKCQCENNDIKTQYILKSFTP